MFILLFFYLSITMAQPCRVMFLTTSRFKGDLGGIEGADRICHFAAANGAKSVKEFIDDGKTFRAILSTTNSSIESRLRLENDISCINEVNGGRVVNNASSLWNAKNVMLKDDIDRNEFPLQNGISEGFHQSATAVWTGTNADGTSAKANCNDFSTNDMGVNGLTGHSVHDDERWVEGVVDSCDASLALYCISDSDYTPPVLANTIDCSYSFDAPANSTINTGVNANAEIELTMNLPINVNIIENATLVVFGFDIDRVAEARVLFNGHPYNLNGLTKFDRIDNTDEPAEIIVDPKHFDPSFHNRIVFQQYAFRTSTFFAVHQVLFKLTVRSSNCVDLSSPTNSQSTPATDIQDKTTTALETVPGLTPTTSTTASSSLPPTTSISSIITTMTSKTQLNQEPSSPAMVVTPPKHSPTVPTLTSSHSTVSFKFISLSLSSSFSAADNSTPDSSSTVIIIVAVAVAVVLIVAIVATIVYLNRSKSDATNVDNHSAAEPAAANHVYGNLPEPSAYGETSFSALA